jgi:hypothetical protein
MFTLRPLQTLVITLLITIIGLVAAPSALASGSLATNQATAAGQVRITTDDGVTYLTTETIPGDPATMSARRSPISYFKLQLPKGFADNFSHFFNSVLSIVMIVAAMLVFFFLIWGAFDWIISGGDRGKTEQARQKMFAAVIGLIVVAASFAVLNIALQFLGFKDINDVFRNARPIDSDGVGSSSATATPSGSLNR